MEHLLFLSQQKLNKKKFLNREKSAFLNNNNNFYMRNVTFSRLLSLVIKEEEIK